MPVWSKLLDCRWDVIESDPRMLDVIGEATIVGRNNKWLELSELPPNEWFPADDPIEVGASVEMEAVDVPAEANRRDGAIEVANEELINEGEDDSAGNFVVDPKAGRAADAFVPRSSAPTREAAALDNTPQNNSINLRFITLAPNIEYRRLTYRWIYSLNRRRRPGVKPGDERLAVAGRERMSNDDGSSSGYWPRIALVLKLPVRAEILLLAPTSPDRNWSSHPVVRRNPEFRAIEKQTPGQSLVIAYLLPPL